jgi:peptide/nickel transport system permease protein
VLTFVARRVLLLVPTSLGVLVAVFSLLHLVPGDPAALMLGETAREEDVAALRTALGLHRPLPEQLVRYLGGVLRGDLGESLTARVPVASLLRERVPPTAALATSSLALALLASIPLGALAAMRRGRLADHASMTLALVGISLPSFWLGPLLLWTFAVRLDLFPTGGAEDLRSLCLPAVTMALPLSALLARMTRASLLDEMGQDYVRVAVAKGLPAWRAVLVHAFRNALIPIVTVVGLQFGALLTGAIITEQVFAWPGLGGLLMEGIGSRDYPVVQGTILLFSLVYVVVNLATDVVYAACDPRVTLS